MYAFSHFSFFEEQAKIEKLVRRKKLKLTSRIELIEWSFNGHSVVIQLY